MVALCGQRCWLKVKHIYAATSMVSYMPPKLRVAVQYGTSSTSIGKTTYNIINATAICVQKQSLSVQLSEYFATLWAPLFYFWYSLWECARVFLHNAYHCSSCWVQLVKLYKARETSQYTSHHSILEAMPIYNVAHIFLMFSGNFVWTLGFNSTLKHRGSICLEI